MFAIIDACGKQYKVSEGEAVYLEKLEAEEGASVTFDKVLLIADGEATRVGAPTLSGVTVTGSVVKNGKGKKINVFKYNAKKNYRRRQGHRQPYTKVMIEKIVG